MNFALPLAPLKRLRRRFQRAVHQMSVCTCFWVQEHSCSMGLCVSVWGVCLQGSKAQIQVLKLSSIPIVLPCAQPTDFLHHPWISTYCALHTATSSQVHISAHATDDVRTSRCILYTQAHVEVHFILRFVIASNITLIVSNSTKIDRIKKSTLGA